MPFWSSVAQVEAVIATVEAYREFEPVELTWSVFAERRLTGLERDGLLVGVNWSGPRANGYDVEPATVREAVEVQIAKL